jgi:flagellar hook-associated protein 1 FlgK
MSGLNATLDIARQAIAANQYGLSVTGQNIANVDNTSYSRQLVELKNSDSVKIGNLVFGSGVKVSQVAGAVDDLLLSWMHDQQATTSAYGEMATNLAYVEELFNLGSNNALDNLFSDFWNSWSELSNTPDGSAERAGVLESGAAIVEQFNDMSESLKSLTTTIDSRIEVAVDSINAINSQIEELNKAITAIEASHGAVANDLRDQRSALVDELSSLLDISTYEQSDSSLLITTARGSAILVGSSGARELSVDGGQVMWESSGGSVDITDMIEGGSIGGWLDVRDEVIPEYEAELDALTEAFVWNVNQQHSQGAGLTYFSGAVTGSYEVDTSTTSQLDTLDLFSHVDLTGDFSIWIDDGSGVPTETVLNFNTLGLSGTSTMGDLVSVFNANVSGVTASEVNGQMVLTPASGYGFAFGGDDSGMAAALGINTFFTGSTAETIGLNSQLDATGNIAAGQLDAAGMIASGDNSNALLLAECGELSVQIDVYTYDRTTDPPFTTANITTSTDAYYRTMVSNLGIVIDSVDRNLETADSLMNELQDRRDGVSAVSLDEEMINLVKYQNAYNAASKLLKVADEMMDTIMSTR